MSKKSFTRTGGRSPGPGALRRGVVVDAPIVKRQVVKVASADQLSV